MELKRHFKMYKSGKQWLVASIAVFALGGAVIIDNNLTTVDASTHVTAKHDNGPRITAQDVVIQKGSVFNPLTAVSAVDQKDGQVAVVVGKNTVDTNKTGTYDVTYKATNKAGNVSKDKVTVKVVDKIASAPQLALKTLTFVQNSKHDLSDIAYAYDSDGKALDVTLLKGTLDFSTLGEHTITIGTKTASGQELENEFTYNVVKDAGDKQAPKLYVANTINVHAGDPLNIDNFAQATDDVDMYPYVEWSVDNSHTIDTSKTGSTKVTFKAYDYSGNVSAAKTVTVNVVSADTKDTTAPVVIDKSTGKAVDSFTIHMNDSFDPLDSVIGFDDFDGLVGPTLSENTIDVSTPGNYSVTYKVSDMAGNAKSIPVPVHVLADDKTPDPAPNPTPAPDPTPDNGGSKTPSKTPSDDKPATGGAGTIIGGGGTIVDSPISSGSGSSVQTPITAPGPSVPSDLLPESPTSPSTTNPNDPTHYKQGSDGHWTNVDTGAQISDDQANQIGLNGPTTDPTGGDVANDITPGIGSTDPMSSDNLRKHGASNDMSGRHNDRNGGDTSRDGYTKGADGKWHRPDGSVASDDEVRQHHLDDNGRDLPEAAAVPVNHVGLNAILASVMGSMAGAFGYIVKKLREE